MTPPLLAGPFFGQATNDVFNG